MTYRVMIYTEDREEVKKIMGLVGLTPSPFPALPVEIEFPNGLKLEIEEILYSGSWGLR